LASSAEVTDHAPSEGVALRVWPLTVTVTSAGASTSVVPVIVGVVSVVIAPDPPSMLTTGGEL
jgi:hypothetical protein